MRLNLVSILLLVCAALTLTLPQNQSDCILSGMCARPLHPVDRPGLRATDARYADSAFAMELAQAAKLQDSGPASIATPIVYRNTQYGFCFLLPADWKGYTVVEDTWKGSPMGDTKGLSIKGPELLLRNPKWTKDDPWQDIPIMIFTLAQWKLADDDEYLFSPAPFGPSEIGRNSRYVFALPARWIGFYEPKGMDEVQTLMNQNPFQAPCGHKSTKPVANLP